MTAERRPGQQVLMGGTFDDRNWFTINRHIWTNSKLHWIADPEIPESANYFRLLRYSRPRQTYTPSDRLLTAPRQSDMLPMVRRGPE
jgi:hypothetical protein